MEKIKIFEERLVLRTINILLTNVFKTVVRYFNSYRYKFTQRIDIRFSKCYFLHHNRRGYNYGLNLQLITAVCPLVTLLHNFVTT